ncbi:YicC/YloC family endoribonuclease [Elizabethkingia meningoseptica]|uniref:YicC/YloC family endoribonuclease n=1 Tax=Elizabethkingia meningoseptica TaxID=238 RepID=UPI0023AF3BA9|nr:YicC/YloC family endoribonuclease [Elizabethkingia meningoseptica]MDE5494160.1 YicC family protein [Elizabethkingia meningoseptica]
MILSMTGFGRAEGICGGKKITIDVKSLNSKGFDLNLKIPFRYKEKEFEIRKILSERIVRGKIDFYLNVEIIDGKTDTTLNKDVIKAYMDELSDIVTAADRVELLKIATKLPDAVSTSNAELSEDEWNDLMVIIDKAIDNFIDFRITEGKSLETELRNYISNIEENLSLVAPYEGARIEVTRERMLNNLKDFRDVDESRFYQELTYYVEKLDISEEKVRLAQHCKYFIEVLNEEDNNGKKLGFISQEIGREINTLGSKANHQEIQKLVVKMKDDLEKIKEQSLNVL